MFAYAGTRPVVIPVLFCLITYPLTGSTLLQLFYPQLLDRTRRDEAPLALNILHMLLISLACIGIGSLGILEMLAPPLHRETLADLWTGRILQIFFGFGSLAAFGGAVRALIAVFQTIMRHLKA